ncbi:MAG: NAD-dependent succinate-semialdehyde dehydrogenase [bacterium]
MKSINPATEQLIEEHTAHTPEEVNQILISVDTAWQTWRTTSYEERAVFLRRAADILQAERDACAAILTAEMGKLKREARAEIEKCALVCRHYADTAAETLKEEMIETNYEKSIITFQPLGVILAVMPWNFPFWQVWRFLAPALMAGNVAVLKHASNVFGAAKKIEEIVRKAGFPQNVFRALIIPSSQVEAVVKHPVVKAVTLTGSEAAGMQVAATAGKELKKTVLELGGSDPFIVLEDADLEKCTDIAVQSRTLNVGQACNAAKRFIVMEGVAPAFEALLKKKMSALVVGDPSADGTDMAPMARGDLVENIHDQVTVSIEMGARLVCGGRKIDRPGFYYEPTILADVKKGMPAYDQETFGPVAAIITVKNAEEAIAVANDTPYGLAASVWAGSTEQGEKMARRIDSGMVFINALVASNPKLPFGGIKRSGYGRECSEYGLREFVNVRTVCS